MSSELLPGRKKVRLQPGHSQLVRHCRHSGFAAFTDAILRRIQDWMRLAQSSQSLRGQGPFPARITMAEVQKHNSPEDAWMVIRDRVRKLAVV